MLWFYDFLIISVFYPVYSLSRGKAFPISLQDALSPATLIQAGPATSFKASDYQVDGYPLLRFAHLLMSILTTRHGCLNFQTSISLFTSELRVTTEFRRRPPEEIPSNLHSSFLCQTFSLLICMLSRTFVSSFNCQQSLIYFKLTFRDLKFT